MRRTARRLPDPNLSVLAEGSYFQGRQTQHANGNQGPKSLNLN